MGRKCRSGAPRAGAASAGGSQYHWGAVVATFIVYDELDRCPYLAGHVARLPLRVPARPLTRGEVDLALAAGDRRQGVFLYRPTCPSCRACEAIRLPVAAFAPSATHRRTLRAGDE
ncbi:MAG: hypothetical protein H0V80_17750, partial [Acidobacteria bacterium]|nr:hypothetical protein [Acidobacteriota bacterium]